MYSLICNLCGQFLVLLSSFSFLRFMCLLCPRTTAVEPVRDNYNPMSHKYVCITTYQQNTESNPNPNLNPNPTNKQHAIVNIQLIQSHVLRIQRNSYDKMLLHRLCDFRLLFSHCPGEQPSVRPTTVCPYPSAVPPGVKGISVWLTETPAPSDFLWCALFKCFFLIYVCVYGS